jgi:ferrous iron transport protein A
MKKNQSGTIVSITGKTEITRRIREMGLIPGATLTLHGRAPLQDPVMIRILNTTLTLRNNEADHVIVDVSQDK